MRREEPLWLHRSQAALLHPDWALESHPVSQAPMHRHRPDFISVRQALPLSWQQARCPATSLAITLPGAWRSLWATVVCWFPCQLSPTSGSSLWEGQGRGRRGWLGFLTEMECLFVMELVFPKPALGLETLRLTPSVYQKSMGFWVSLMHGKLTGCLGKELGGGIRYLGTSAGSTAGPRRHVPRTLDPGVSST